MKFYVGNIVLLNKILFPIYIIYILIPVCLYLLMAEIVGCNLYTEAQICPPHCIYHHNDLHVSPLQIKKKIG